MEKYLHKNILIAGRTGSGKSNFLHNIITYLLEENSPAEVRLILIEPKRVEFAQYNGVAHLLSEVILDAGKAKSAFKWAWGESLRRLKMIEEARKASMYEYNKIEYKKNKLPEIYIIIDEFSDLMASDGYFFQEYFEKLTALSKMTGVYLLVASAKVISTVFAKRINNCFVDRICFLTAIGEGGSSLIIGEKDAEKLKGNGNCLIKNLVEFKTDNCQMPHISDDEIVEKIKSIKEKHWNFNFQELPEDEDDSLYLEAKKIVIKTGKASASLLQRRLMVGYSRASRLIDMLEENGVIGEANGAEPRKVLKNI